jgi:hypothetical protein
MVADPLDYFVDCVEKVTGAADLPGRLGQGRTGDIGI